MFAILDDQHNVVPVDLLTWSKWFETADDARRVGLDEVTIKRTWRQRLRRLPATKVRVSTVFLGIDYNFTGLSPLWFETMVFADYSGNDLFCRRYSTWEEAEIGHARTVMAVRSGGNLDELPGAIH